MGNKLLPEKYVIQAAVPRSLAQGGFILVSESLLLDEEIEHAITLVWRDGRIVSEVRADYSARSICIINKPAPGLVKTSNSGTFTTESRAGLTVGNIFEDTYSANNREIFGSIHGVYAVAGKAFAVGFGGVAYRMDNIGHWTWIGKQLPESVELTGVDGFSDNDVYACGMNGAIWRFKGQNWRQIDSPTNVHLHKIRCAPNGFIYAAGEKGMLLQGKDDVWQIIEHYGTEHDIWGLECFNEKLYLSTFSGVFTLNGDELITVDFGNDSPKTTHRLASCSECIWSVGDHDIVSFDGKNWTRVV